MLGHKVSSPVLRQGACVFGQQSGDRHGGRGEAAVGEVGINKRGYFI